MDRVALRILSFKSTMNFGKYADYTVQQVLDQNPIDGRKYLIWIYYNSSNISFNESVLDELRINKDNTIKKPGKVASPEIFYFFIANTRYRGGSTEKERNTLLANHNMAKKFIRGSIKHHGFNNSNKTKLQNKNHGR